MPKPAKLKGKPHAKSGAGKPKAKETVSADYLGCFSFDRPGDPSWTGRFQVLVTAASPEQAVQRIRARLRGARDASGILDPPVTIYSDGFIRLGGSFEEPVIVNFSEHQANFSEHPDAPVDVTLTNLTPDRRGTKVESFDIVQDGDDEKPFLDFGGRAVAKALHAAKSKADASRGSIEPIMPTRLPKRTAEERRLAKEEAAARKLQRAAAATQRRERLQASREATAKRKRSIAETMRELGQRR